MTIPILTPLPNRSLIAVEGNDARDFLQGLISNDVTKVSFGQAIYSALLTPQGKFLFDFFVIQPKDKEENILWLETDGTNAESLLRRLKMFKLRSQVNVEAVDCPMAFYSVMDVLPEALIQSTQAIFYSDTRDPQLGHRLIIDSDTPLENCQLDTSGHYNQRRIELGIPLAPDDLQQEKTGLLEANFDQINGLDWDKGCYMGQEVTARTHYRGLVKKRLVPLSSTQDNLMTGEAIYQDSKKVGTIHSTEGKWAMASLRIDAARSNFFKGKALLTDTTKQELTIKPPVWLLHLLKETSE